MENLNKSTFLVVGRSLGVPRFVFGSSLVFYTRLKGKVQGNGILRKSTFCASAGGVAFKGKVMVAWLR